MRLYGEARHARHSGPASPARAHAIVPGMTVLAALEQETRMAGTGPAMRKNQSFSSGKIDAKGCAETQARFRCSNEKTRAVKLTEPSNAPHPG